MDPDQVRFVTRCVRATVDRQSRHVRDGPDRGRAHEREAEEAANGGAHSRHKQVQVVPRPFL